MVESSDLIEELLGIGPASSLGALRRQREPIRQHIQGTFRALITPPRPGTVSLAARAGLAWRATRHTDSPLLNYYKTLLAAHGESGPRFESLLEYGDRVALRPETVDQNTIDHLLQAGFSAQDVVASTQLAAFVPFQVRLLAGLRAFTDTVNGVTGRQIKPKPGQYTSAEVGWLPRLEPVEAATATPAQLEALEACPPNVRRSTYFLTLAHDPASLAERGALFNSVMYAPRGLPRADRELATAIVSMVNGCVYCTSVHARRFIELTHEPQLMQGLFDQGFEIALSPRRRAIVDFAAKLTAYPQEIGAADLIPLRGSGLAELEILDLIHAIAMFANANRLMQALGSSVLPSA